MFGIKNIGSPEVIIIAIVVLFFFGGSKISEFTKGLTESKKELNKIKEDLKHSDHDK